MDPTGGASGGGSAVLRGALKSQFHAALPMLREPIDKRLPDVWEGDGHTNAFWQIADRLRNEAGLGVGRVGSRRQG